MMTLNANKSTTTGVTRYSTTGDFLFDVPESTTILFMRSSPRMS